ncbi:flagellar hook-length control protein FliK [Helicobacter sp. MIT 21-1697]|uniref:flagellar hook-length control protein FliK n=1 Tax=Helicobacter sp. MIT 21-1697 TaxID=2993733 RepID=UPI00224B232A|nr:flagellar hook-length control protein FliK [Helicobacter sp. MIT 21-1697]MCX2717833.1 flagellar hook-length control protein FliK [Helicobacter sp. MIT 21-1697]
MAKGEVEEENLLRKAIEKTQKIESQSADTIIVSQQSTKEKLLKVQGENGESLHLQTQETREILISEDKPNKPKKTKKTKATKKNANENEIINEDTQKVSLNKNVKNNRAKKEVDIAPDMVKIESLMIAKGEVIKEPKNMIETNIIDEAKNLNFEENLLPQMQESMQKHPAKASSNNTQSAKNSTNVLLESLSTLATFQEKKQEKNNENKKEAHKENKKEKKGIVVNESNASKSAAQTEEIRSKAENTAQVNEEQVLNEQESLTFEEILTPTKGRKKQIKAKEAEESAESKPKSTLSKQSAEMSNVRENQRTQILYRSALARESMRNFAQNLREEVLNYKPPLTKLSMELHPQNLGTLELTITKKGKDLHIQVVSNATAVGLFLQNQADFKNNLAQVGFDNVDLSFSSNSSGGGGKQSEQNASQSNEHNQEGNKNSLEDSQREEINVMNITLPKYA